MKKKFKIGIIPSIKAPYKNQLEFTTDYRLISFLKKLNIVCDIIILTLDTKIDKNFKLIIFSGGNDLLKFSQSSKDKFRNKIDQLFFTKATKLKIPMLGICYGATYVANKFNAKFIKKKKIGFQIINIVENKFFKNKQKIIRVNSFKNYSINKINANAQILALAKDKTIESFYIKKINFLGLMWHPERFKTFRNFDIDLLNKII